MSGEFPMSNFELARELIREFKGSAYRNGFNVLDAAGEMTRPFGKRAVFVCDVFAICSQWAETIEESLRDAGVDVLEVIDGAAPNAPRQDVFRIACRLKELDPDVMVTFGGGSTIDAVKAAGVLHTLGGDIEEYFGTGVVSAKLAATGKALRPHVAIQTAASSGAHLTKYSNVTDLTTGQKKLIVDEAIVPQRGLFDYGVTFDAPASLTIDGALDGVAHVWEVLEGAIGKPYYDRMEPIAREGMRLALRYLPVAASDAQNRDAREALGLATDLGAYAIMLGGTSGPHLTSFSLIDVLSHGRACGMLNPYYTVFFGSAIQEPLQLAARVCVETGFADGRALERTGRELATTVAEALMKLQARVDVPVRLNDALGFGRAHIDRALCAARNPQLRMKLENMPVPLTPEMVDDYMGPVLEAAATGDLSLIRTVGSAACA
jgi:alcohol dehydrogenase class IV